MKTTLTAKLMDLDVKDFDGALEAALEDAARYQWLKARYGSANVMQTYVPASYRAILFAVPVDGRITPDLDATIDALRKVAS